MIPFSEIIRQLLIDLEVATEEDSFIGFFPDMPDEAACVYDSQARPDGRIMTTGERIDHPGIQIMVRGIPYKETFQRAHAIAIALDGVQNISVAPTSEDAYVVHNVSRSGGVLSVGIETVKERRRHLFSINATVTLSVESE